MRSSRVVLATLVVASLVASLSPADAAVKTITRRYEGPLMLGYRRTLDDPTCNAPVSSCKLATDRKVEIGSITFPPLGGTGTAKVTIRVVDDQALSGKVHVHYCEDTNQSGTCTSADRINRYGCYSKSQVNTLLNVKRTNNVIVNISAVYGCTQYINDVPSDPHVASSGTVTVSWIY